MPPGNILIKAVPFLSWIPYKRNLNLSLFFLIFSSSSPIIRAGKCPAGAGVGAAAIYVKE